MKTNIIFLILTLLPVAGFSQDLYRQLAERKIKNDQKIIDKLTSENKRLKRGITDIRASSNENDRKLKEVIKELFATDLALQMKENDLNYFRYNVAFLQRENLDLKQSLEDMIAKLSEINEENLEYEQELAVSLENEGKLELAIKAKNQTIGELVFELKRKNQYAGFSVGVGTNYSGVGGSFSFRLGRTQGLGLHFGAGYLKYIFQTEGIYANAGFNYFFSKNWLVDATYHYNVKHFSGYYYNDLLSIICGWNCFLGEKKIFGLKLGLGGLYTDGVIGPEIIPAGDFGIMVKF